MTHRKPSDLGMVSLMCVPAGRSERICTVRTCLLALQLPEIAPDTGWLQPALQHWPILHVGVAGRFGQKSDGTANAASDACTVSYRCFYYTSKPECAISVHTLCTLMAHSGFEV
jgi:hypothetical protein